MDNVLKNLEMQIKNTRKQIARENKGLKDFSVSINDDLYDGLAGFTIKESVSIMQARMNHLMEYSVKLEQLEKTYRDLTHEKEQR